MSNKSLGRGLGSLLGESLDTDFDLSDSSEVSITQLTPSPYQPRKEFDTEALNALTESIKDKGVLQPLLVRKVGEKYEIIAGERRWRASQGAGLTQVPVIIKDFSDKETLEVALVENLIRENLSAIEEAEAFQRLITEFSHTQEALSNIVGKSRSHVANTLRLLGLPLSIQNMIKEGNISAGHARQLVGLENAEDLAKKIVEKELSVRQTEEMISKIKAPKQSSSEPKAKKDEDLANIEKDLVKALGLRLKITPSKQGGGKVVLQYSSVAELDMIIDILEKKQSNNVPMTVPNFPAPVVQAETTDKFSIKIVD